MLVDRFGYVSCLDAYWDKDLEIWVSRLRFITYNGEQLAMSFWLNFSLIGPLEKGCEVTPSFL